MYTKFLFTCLWSLLTTVSNISHHHMLTIYWLNNALHFSKTSYTVACECHDQEGIQCSQVVNSYSLRNQTTQLLL